MDAKGAAQKLRKETNMPVFIDSAYSNAAARLRRRIQTMIEDKDIAAKSRQDLLDKKNGVFNFGAYQLNTLNPSLPCARFGVPGSNTQACP